MPGSLRGRGVRQGCATAGRLNSACADPGASGYTAPEKGTAVTKAIVLGGYGLIGLACMKALDRAGFGVTGVGRSAGSARRVAPDAEWVIRDIAGMEVADWRQLVAGAGVVVNAAGALQDGARDDLVAIHETAVERLVEAMAGSGARLVQISAAGVGPDASTHFFRTKARGDAAIRDSDLDWVILRPTLVIAPGAYGGTALLRGAAGFPWIEAEVMPEAMIQTVHVEDVARAVVRAARGEIASGTEADLTEAHARPLPEVIALFRRWLGFRTPRMSLQVPRIALRAVARLADVAGYLGWRSPLRTTAIRTLSDGVRGDPAAWEEAGGPSCRPIGQTLSDLPSTMQERWFARTYLLFPLAILTLSVFWAVSGIIGLVEFDAARAVLTERGYPSGPAGAGVIAGAVIDLLLAAFVLWRPWTRAACLAMAVVSAGYLVAGTILTPDIWADPLGRFVKVLPVIALSLLAAALAEER